MEKKRYWMVYFEFLGKKQKIKIFASSEESARQELYQRLTIHKAEIAKDYFNDIVDEMDKAMDMFDFLAKSKSK